MSLSTCAIANVMLSDEPPEGSTKPTYDNLAADEGFDIGSSAGGDGYVNSA